MTSQRPTGRFPAWELFKSFQIFLYFFLGIWYNVPMEKKEITGTSTEEMVTISLAEYEKLLGQGQQLLTQNVRISRLEKQVELLMEALRLSRQKRFGASSEKADAEAMEQFSFLFNEAEVLADAKAEDEDVVVVPEHKRHKGHEYTLDSLPEDVPTQVAEHTLEGEDLICPQCGDTMTDIGVDVVKKLKIKSVELVVEEHRYHTYACQTCNRENTQTPVVKAPREKSVIPGSFARDSRQLRHTGGHCPHYGAEIRHGQSAIPPGTGAEKTGRQAFPADHVQLDSESFGGVSDPGVQKAVSGAAEAGGSACG